MMATISFPVTFIVLVTVLQLGSSRYPPTCTGLDQFVASTNRSLTSCQRDQDCSTVTCNTVGAFSAMVESSIITLQPCTSPSSVHLLVTAPPGRLGVIIFEGVLNTSTSVFLATIANPHEVTIEVFILIVISQNSLNAIGLEADLLQVFSGNFPTFNTTQTLNALTHVPLDLASCVTTTTSSPSASTTDAVATSDFQTTHGSAERCSRLRTFSLLFLSVLASMLSHLPSR